MGKGRGTSDRGTPAITADEAELWRHATREVEPVRGKPRIHTAPEAPPAVPRRPAPAPGHAKRAAESKVAAAAPSPAGRAAPHASLADFDRRKARQIASGKVEIGARLDLHGCYQRDARVRLRAFLLDAHARGLRTVLVITGKGNEAEPDDPLASLAGERRRGVLRRSVPIWLAEPELRAIVLSHTEAAIRHGGSGALYVQLRKPAASR